MKFEGGFIYFLVCW